MTTLTFFAFIIGLSMGSASNGPYCHGEAKCVYKCQVDGTCNYNWSMEPIDSRCEKPANNCFKDCRDICGGPYVGVTVTVGYTYGKYY